MTDIQHKTNNLLLMLIIFSLVIFSIGLTIKTYTDEIRSVRYQNQFWTASEFDCKEYRQCTFKTDINKFEDQYNRTTCYLATSGSSAHNGFGTATSISCVKND